MKILSLKERLSTQINYRFGTHSEKSFEQLSLCGCGKRLVKVGERFTEKLNIIPERIYVEKHIYPVYACRNCEGSGDKDHPVFRQAPAAKNIIQQGIATPDFLSYIFILKL